MLMSLKLTTVFSFLCWCQSEFRDYYWRDYDGENIPTDAIEGGEYENKPFYVGQAFFEEGLLLPVTIYDPSIGKKPTTSVGQKILEANKNVKILCSPRKEDFEWIASSKLASISDTHFVIGGSEAGQQLYIGRIVIENEWVLGKVFQDSQPNKGLWIPPRTPHTNNNYLRYYHVLTFRCGQVVDDEAFGKCH